MDADLCRLNKKEFKAYRKEIKNKNDMSYLFISLDEEVVNLFADRIIRLNKGKIV